MSLQFIFGNSGAGKSYYLYQEVIRESIENPNVNYLVLVPEQFTMQTQKDLCTMHPKGGIMNIDVLSFGRLAHRVFEEVGGDTKAVLDDEGKNLILRKIAGDYENELKILRGNLKKQGYISEVKSVISEFTQYGIGFEELDAMLEKLEPESYLSYKLQDIKMVYAGFQDYLEERYITKEELLSVLGDVVTKSQLLKQSVVVLDGFTGFTPVQNKLLGQLLSVCREVLITVVMDKREDPFIYQHPYQLFGISKQMVTSLMKIAGEGRIEVKEPVCLYDTPVRRFLKNETLGFLESELFRYSKRNYEKSPEALELHVARNPKGEAEFVAQQIRYMVRTKGYRYRDISVIVSDMNTYAEHLKKVCGVYNIPIFMDHKKSILLNSFVEYVRSLLAMGEQNFSYESVFRFLRTGLTGFTSEEADTLENYVVALGIKGYKKWQSAWVRRQKGMNDEGLLAVNGLRVRFVEQLDALVFVLKQRKKTIKDITTAVYEYFVRERLQAKVRTMELNFLGEKELALAKEYAQIYRIVIELLDKFVELLGEEFISLKGYCELLDAGLEEAKVGVIPPSIDQVMIGDVERTRLKNIKTLFFMGANDTFLPGNAGQGGLLSERDRERFAGENYRLSPGAKEKTYIQKFYLYMNLTKPSEQLYISFAKVSADGKTLRPAYLISDLKKMFPLLTVKDEEEKRIGEKELTVNTGIEYLIRGLRERSTGIGDEWKELYTWYRNQKPLAEKLETMVQAGFYQKKWEPLSEEMTVQLFGESPRLSVTRLERFAACAYAHFLSYGLRLEEREEYQFAAMDLGNIAHSAMEHFAKKAEAAGVLWTEMTEVMQEELIAESVEESITDYGNTILYSSARNEYMITRIKRMVHRTVWALTKQLAQGDFQPSAYELNFGSGKIDRIDTCEEADKLYVKVTDYKTGSKSFDIVSLYHGLQMQLVVYLNAAMELEQKKHPEKEIIPAGIFYYQMKDPIVGKEADDEVLEQKILKELKLDGLVNADKEAIEHLEKHLTGASNLIPVGRTKDGSLSRNSKVLSPEEFHVMTTYTKQNTAKLEAQMFSGKTTAKPYELGEKSGCDYCGYKAVCGFDIHLDGYEYHRLEKFPKEEVLEKMRNCTNENQEEEV